MNSLVVRHLRVFFRDKGNVFFALLSSIVMFALYIFFLGSIQADSLQDGVATLSNNLANNFVNSWVFAGIITITAVTTSLAAFSVFISDRAEGRLKDYAVSPIARWKLTLSYIAASIIISSLLTILAAVLGQAYLLFSGGEFIGLENALQLIPLLVFLSAVFSSFACLITTFVKTSAAFTSLSIIIGTSVGFLAGIYVPVGSLPSGVANVINTLPFAQAATLTRQPFATDTLTQISQGSGAQTEALKDMYGFNITVGDATLSTMTLLLLLTGLAVICLAIAVVRMARVLKTV